MRLSDGHLLHLSIDVFSSSYGVPKFGEVH